MAVKCSSCHAGEHLCLCEPGGGCFVGSDICRRKDHVFSSAGACYHIGECVAAEFVCLQKEAGRGKVMVKKFNSKVEKVHTFIPDGV